MVGRCWGRNQDPYTLLTARFFRQSANSPVLDFYGTLRALKRVESSLLWVPWHLYVGSDTWFAPGRARTCNPMIRIVERRYRGFAGSAKRQPNSPGAQAEPGILEIALNSASQVRADYPIESEAAGYSDPMRAARAWASIDQLAISVLTKKCSNEHNCGCRLIRRNFKIFSMN
jgi:hypothetical protein